MGENRPYWYSILLNKWRTRFSLALNREIEKAVVEGARIARGLMLAFCFRVAVWMDLFNFLSLNSLYGCYGLFRMVSLLVQ
jgi:hypothetical protein